MKRTEYIQYDGIDITNLIRQREVSAADILKASIAQAEMVNGDLNAVARYRTEAAHHSVQQLSSKGTDGAFTGVPMVLKDLAQTIKGEENVSGTQLLKGNMAQTTSHIVNRMLHEGCIPVAYSTTPELGLKNITEAKVYGATRNPWNHNHSPGGSSGGSAALVSAGVVPIGGASDGGGSIRIPASFTGLFGLKPTRGRTPVGPGVGRQWQGAAIDFVLTKSVRDSARMLDQLQVVQEEAAFQTPLFTDGFEYTATTSSDKKFTIGFTLDSPVGTAVSEDAIAAVRKVVKYLEANGHQVKEVQPDIDGKQLMRDYYMMNSGEIAALLTQLEAVKGSKLQADDMEMATWMLYIAGQNVTAADFSKSLASWDTAAAKMATFHQQYDLYLTPASAFTAPKIGELTPSPEKSVSYKSTIQELDAAQQQELIYDMFLPSLTYTPFTQLANLTGQPAMSVPIHVSETNGLPIGAQLIARKGREDQLLQLAQQLESSDIWEGMKGNPYFATHHDRH